MWTTETPGKTRTTMQVAMTEARSRKFAATVSSLKPLVELFREIGRAFSAAAVKIARAIQEFGEAVLAIQRRPPYPGAISFERRGMRSASSGMRSLPSFGTRGLGLSPSPGGRGFSPSS